MFLGYSVRLRNFNRVFDDTVEVYRHAVDYFIELVIANWNTHFANLSRANDCIRVAEGLSVRTKKRLMTPYNFCHDFMKFPSYLRRVAIKAAYGYMVSSPFASIRGIFWVQLPLEGASMRVLHSIRGEATPLHLAFRGFVWVIPARNRIVKLSWNSAGR